MVFKTEQEAINVFANEIAFGKNSVITRCPHNFCLYKLGDFNNTTGVIIPYDNPVSIVNGFELLEQARIVYKNYTRNLDFVKGGNDESGNETSSDLQNSVDSGDCNNVCV